MRSQEKDLFTLKNKVIVVTGATGVLGGSFVEAISKQGATVLLIGQNESVGEERARFIRSQGGEAVLKANVLVEAELEAAKNKAVETYGTIHGLVNGAGGNLPEGVLSPDQDVFTMNMEGMKDNGAKCMGYFIACASIWSCYCKIGSRKYCEYFFCEFKKNSNKRTRL